MMYQLVFGDVMDEMMEEYIDKYKYQPVNAYNLLGVWDEV